MNATQPYPQIILASRNQKKIAEIADQLNPFDISVVSVSEFPDVADVVEDGTTFGENAAKKAREVAQQTGQWAIGEDSGLMVDALDGAPGIFSARYSGESATDERNNEKLIAELDGLPATKRSAQYVCHVALSNPVGEIRLSIEATCRGRISEEPHGKNGFGYDPYFTIPELHKTFGELNPAVKRHISHRARAFERFIPQLIRLIQSKFSAS